MTPIFVMFVMGVIVVTGMVVGALIVWGSL
jgi:hypothetical protein